MGYMKTQLILKLAGLLKLDNLKLDIWIIWNLHWRQAEIFCRFLIGDFQSLWRLGGYIYFLHWMLTFNI